MPTTRRPDPAEVRAAREARRLRAAELFAQGRTQAEVAHELGVSRQSAHVWHTRLQEGGVDALRSRGHLIELWPDWAQAAGSLCAVVVDEKSGALLGAVLPVLGVVVIAAFNAFYWLPIRGESPRPRPS